MSNFHVKVKAEVPEDFLSDVLITAFDGDHGGSWFWAKPHRPAPDDFWVITDGLPTESDSRWLATYIEDREEQEEWMMTRDPDDPDKPKVYKVTYAVLVKGIQELIDAGDDNIQQAVFDADAGMIDANDADSIVQQGLFGKQVYG